MKIKLTNMLRGKERKNRYAKLNRGRWKRFIYIKDQLQGEKNRKGKQRNKCRKIYSRFKKLKIKIIKKRKEKKEDLKKGRRQKEKGKLHRTAKVQCRGRGL